MSKVDLAEFIKGMSLSDFIITFGHLVNTKTRKIEPWKLWRGQYKLLKQIDKCETDGCTESWYLKARQLGITTIASWRAIKLMLEMPGAQGLVISKDETSAKYLLEHRIEAAYNALPKLPGISYPKATKTATSFSLSNGSTVFSLPAAGTAGASVTLNFVILDEGALIDRNNASGGLASIYTAVEAALQHAGKTGWMMVISTAETGSYFNRKTQELLQQLRDDGTWGSSEQRLLFVPSSTHPERDSNWRRITRAKYPSEVDFLSQYPEKPEDCFLSREGKIFPQFDRSIHVREFPVSWQEARYEPRRYVAFLGFDHGFSHPSCLLYAIHDYKTDTLYIVREWYWQQVQAETIAEEIRKDILPQLPIAPSKKIADRAIFNETGIYSVARVYKDAGIIWQKSRKTRMTFSQGGAVRTTGLEDIDGTIGLMSTRLTRRTLMFDPSCRRAIKEVADWHWATNAKGETKDKPIDKDDEAPDVVRYLIAEIHDTFASSEPSHHAGAPRFSPAHRKWKAQETSNPDLDSFGLA